MVGDVGQLEAQDSTFNNAGSNQYNYRLQPGAQYRPPIAHPIVAARHPPAPPPEDQGADEEISPQVAQARMFGNVQHVETVNSTFNNSGGNQTNVDYDANPVVVPIYSGSPSSSPLSSPLPSPTTTTPGLPQQAAKPSKNPFTRITQLHGHATVNAPVPDDMHTSGTDKIKTAASAVAMSVAIDTMTLLDSAAKLSSVPFLGQASTAVLSLLATVQTVKDNDGDFKRLANHACNLVSSVIIASDKRKKQGRELDPELLASLEVLVGKILPIEEFLREKKSRSGVKGNLKKFLHHRVDVASINDCREKLTQALAEFGLRANINVEDGVAQIDKRLEELTEAMERFGIQSRQNSQNNQFTTAPAPVPAPDQASQRPPPRPSFPSPEINYGSNNYPQYSQPGRVPNVTGGVYNVVGGHQYNTENHFDHFSGGVQM